MKKVLSQILLKVIRKAIKNEANQESRPPAISAFSRNPEPIQMTNPYQTDVNRRNLNPVAITSHAYARSSSGDANKSEESKLLSGILGLFYNLMYALARQIVGICNLTQRHSLAAHLENLRIPQIVRRRTGLKRAPLPSWKIVENFAPRLGDQVFLCTLADVANPGAQPNFAGLKDFYVQSRDSGVALASSELLQSTDVLTEFGVVIHGRECITCISNESRAAA